MANYTVELTEGAEKTYLETRNAAADCVKRGDLTNAKVTTLQVMDDFLDRIATDPFEKGTCLSVPFEEIYWAISEKLRFYFIPACDKSFCVQVVAIFRTPRSESHARRFSQLEAQIMRQAPKQQFVVPSPPTQ